MLRPPLTTLNVTTTNKLPSQHAFVGTSRITLRQAPRFLLRLRKLQRTSRSARLYVKNMLRQAQHERIWELAMAGDERRDSYSPH